MTKKLLFVTTILLVLAFAAFAADINGKYVFEQAGRNGNVKVTLTLKTDGGKLTGSVSRPGRDGNAMETPISEATINGANIAFKTSVEMGGNTRVTSYAGTVADDEIKLKVTAPGRGGGDPVTTEVVAKKSTT